MNLDTTTIIALYGAILSTVTAGFTFYKLVTESKRDKRKLKVILEFVTFYEYYRVRLVNTGFRKITVVSLSAILKIKTEYGGLFIDNVPSNALLIDEGQLPKILDDGETMVLCLSRLFSQYKSSKIEKLIVFAHDSEGTKYEQFNEVDFNSKYDRYERQEY